MSAGQTTTSDPDTLAANIASAQAQVDSAEATLKSAETALAQTKLYAPASGTVVSVERRLARRRDLWGRAPRASLLERLIV